MMAMTKACAESGAGLDWKLPQREYFFFFGLDLLCFSLIFCFADEQEYTRVLFKRSKLKNQKSSCANVGLSAKASSQWSRHSHKGGCSSTRLLAMASSWAAPQQQQQQQHTARRDGRSKMENHSCGKGGTSQAESQGKARRDPW